MTKRPSHHPIKARTTKVDREPHRFVAELPPTAKSLLQAETEPTNPFLCAKNSLSLGMDLRLPDRSVHNRPAPRSQLSP